MKRKQGSRILTPAMTDSYSRAELYAVFENEVFGKSKEMDISMLRETLRHLDDRDDADIAPHKDYTWNKIMQHIKEMNCPFVLGMTKRRFAVMVAVLILLITTVSLAITFYR